MIRGPHRLLGALLVVGVLGAACSGDDDPAAPPDTTTSALPPSTTAAPERGGLDVPAIPGTFAAPLVGLGLGIAIPEGWQATLLTEDALTQLEDADLARPSFAEAARRVASTGAVFYAAGIDDEERVAELKVDVQDAADTDPAAVRAVAEAVADGGEVEDATVVDELGEEGRIRVDYRVELPSAEDGETISALGSQLFVIDGDRLWSFIVTSEDEATQQALLDVFGPSITFD